MTDTGSETIDNIRRVTESQDACLGYYYTNEQGDLVTVNLYDISHTDPADILGSDIFDEDQEGSQANALSGSRLLGEVDPRDVEDRLRSVTEKERFVSGGGEGREGTYNVEAWQQPGFESETIKGKLF